MKQSSQMASDLFINQHAEDITLDDLKIHQSSKQDNQKGWYEVKMTGKLPERRSYQISDVYNDHLYIFGGQDLKEGAYNSLWRLPLQHIMDGGTTSWELVTNCTGKKPKPISHHSGFVHQDTLYIYGGLIESDSNKDLYALNLNTMNWTIVDQSSCEKVPAARDDHSACLDDKEGLMIIFGGYVMGGKANDLWCYNFEQNEWTELEKGDYMITDHKYHLKHANERPTPRIGAGMIYHNKAVYLFGGHDEANEKLDDFWKFDLSTKSWSQIQAEGTRPTGRNGLTMVDINNKIVMFGGILEVTKETDEVFIYDFAMNKWFIYETQLNLNGGNSPMMMRDGIDEEDKSVIGGNSQKMNTLKKNKQTSSMPNLNNSVIPDFKNSSQKFNQNNYNSTLNNNNQLDSTLNNKRGAAKETNSLTRKQTVASTDQQFVKYMRGQQTLSSPTSIQMKNAFILKNSNQSFEQYFQAMKRRRYLKNGLSINLSMSLEGGHSKSAHIHRNKPSARDGHSSFVFHNKMFIFGGDRHHMPFNDLYFLDIDI
eukprot:403366836